MKSLGFCWLFLLGVFAAQAQFNDTIHYYVRHTTTGIINKTNGSSAYVLNNALRFTLNREEFALNTFGSWIYGRQGEVLSNNDVQAVVDVDAFKARHKIYGWGLTNYERSYSLKINHRLQAGAGVGYYLIYTPACVFQISDGLLYERSDLYDLPDGTSADADIARNSFRIKFKVVYKDIITFDGSDFWQHALSDRDDYIIRSTTHLGIRLARWLSFTSTVTYNKISRTQRENLLVNVGFSFEKYF